MVIQNLKEKVSKDKDKDLRKYIKFRKGKALVDWQSIEEINPRGGTYSATLYNKIMKSLIDLGILSFISHNNYGLYDFDIPINPGLCGLPGFLYFTKEEDAIKYLKASDYNNSSTIRKLE